MRLVLCLEQALGHRAHTANLELAMARQALDGIVVRVNPESGRLVPWAVSGSWRARSRIRLEAPEHRVRFFHTQSIALMAPLFRNTTPYVVSVDATPIQMDHMGHWYSHEQRPPVVERAKMALYKAVFNRSAAMVAWSQWAADSLVADYGVARDKILVAHPGATSEFFALPLKCDTTRPRPRILFVGGDLERKGADLLLHAWNSMRDVADLTIVTTANVPESDGIEVIADASPGSPRLLEAYASADIFCLPTRGDCTPVVLGEAMAAGLPVITTRIGSNGETVTNGVNGLLIDVNDSKGLHDSLSHLVAQADERTRMARAARATALNVFDAERNAARIFRLLDSLV